jgi:ParB family chromosome partitioning protein
VPVVIRQGEESGKLKLELAIIENFQREDLNAIDRARALAQLAHEFGLTHAEIGAKSRAKPRICE